MKHITHDEIIIERISAGNFSEEYIVERDASLTLILFVTSATGMSVAPSVRLHGSGAKAKILGVATGVGNAVIHIQTLQHHEAPNTESNLLIKSVMADASACIYEGSIVVDKNAQKTDAYQRNENLLLGDHAQATSKPALEIQANDVRCTHGALVKTFDTDELWYAATRGLDTETAKKLITVGFLTSTFIELPDTMVREGLEQKIISLFQS